MSWWVYLRKDGETVEVDRLEEGGTHLLGGSNMAELNVTYTYSRLFTLALHDEGFAWLKNKRAGETVEALSSAVNKLGTTKYQDYWAPTCGNAGHALSILLKWAQQHPDATCEVS